MGESTVVRMSEDGVVVIPVEIREVLGVKDQEAFLRLNDIEVARIPSDDEDGGDS